MAETLELMGIPRAVGDTVYIVRQGYMTVTETGRPGYVAVESTEAEVVRVTKTLLIARSSDSEFRCKHDGVVFGEYRLKAYPSYEHYRALHEAKKAEYALDVLRNRMNLLLREGKYEEAETLAHDSIESVREVLEPRGVTLR